MPILPLIAFTAGTALKAYGEYKQYTDQSNAAKFNSLLSEQGAQLEEQSNQLNLFRIRREAKKTYGTQRALYARAGVSSAGSPLEVMADTAANYELDAQVTNYNSKVQQNRLLSQAQQDRQLSKSLRRQAIISPFTTILSSAGQFALPRV